MITVTFGTIPYPFDRAVDWLDTLLSNNIIREPIVVQHGVTDVSRLKKYPFVKTFPIVSMQNMVMMVKASRLVISHGGQGSTQSLAANSIPFIIIPRLAKYGEHIDDHQLFFAEAVESLGVEYCQSLQALEQAILTPPTSIQPLFAGEPKLVNHLIRTYPAEKPVQPSFIRGKLGKISQKFHRSSQQIKLSKEQP